MKKRLLSLLLTVCLVAALFTGLTGTANAADDKVVGYLTSYTLKAGDTIYGVCEAKKIDFNANLAMIGKINGITNYNYMMPGKVLWLPTKTATTSRIILSSRTRSSPGRRLPRSARATALTTTPTTSCSPRLTTISMCSWQDSSSFCLCT